MTIPATSHLRETATGLALCCVATLNANAVFAAHAAPRSVEENAWVDDDVVVDDSVPTPPGRDFGQAPQVPRGPLPEALERAVAVAFGDNLKSRSWGAEQRRALELIGASGDPRLAWILSDLMRVSTDYEQVVQLTESAIELLGIELNPRNPWGATTDHLIAWDVPAPPDYMSVKRRIYGLIEPNWERLFGPGDIDWRHVSWGGVLMDTRAFGATDDPCNCIPAADNPAVTDATSATWLAADAVVFGVEVNGEYRAYPRQIMEVREMVNDTLGGRDLGIPYCTLCASAQAYFTDQMPEGLARPVLRTSGLLLRSNKVMYDLNTHSVIDTFLGTAVSGPMAEAGVVLKQAGVVTTTWSRWKAAHPTTTVLAESLALGRNFDFRNNRDANGPIFPVGDVDPRLPVQADVFGVVTESGTAVAFDVDAALTALRRAETIQFENVHLVTDGGGLRAVDAEGRDLGGHQAFWFAWSQFHPETKLWSF